MRILLRGAVAASLLAIGIGGAWAAARTGPASPLCAAAAGVNHVGIVVEHGDGVVIHRCVSFTSPTITALDVLHDSGIQYSTSGFGGLGEAVCQIDNEPASYSSCLPSSGLYWVFFVAGSNGIWNTSAHGASTTSVSDGGDVGFRYDPLAGADPPPVSPAGVCPVSTPAPTPTAAPTASGAPTPRPTARPVETSGAAGSTPPDATGSVRPGGQTPPASTGGAPATQGPGVLGRSSPVPSARGVLGAATTAGIDGPFNPALLIAVCAIAALGALLGVQGLRRRGQ